MAPSPEAIRPAYRPVRPGPAATVVETAREVWSRRRLILYLVRATLKKRGADTLLGNVWWVLDPLLTMLVYVILISVIFQSTREAYPLFIFCAILPWKWFAASVGDAVTSVTTRERVIKQVRFPKIVLPIAVSFAGLAGFAFGLVPLAAMLLLAYPDHLSPWIVALPIVAAVQFVLSVAVAIVVSALTVFYRDIGNLATHLLRIWFYLSPALYGADQVERYAASQPLLVGLFELNPFVALFESYRNIVYAGTPPTWDRLLLVLVESAVLLVVSVVLFRRLEPAFAKVL